MIPFAEPGMELPAMPTMPARPHQTYHNCAPGPGRRLGWPGLSGRGSGGKIRGAAQAGGGWNRRGEFPHVLPCCAQAGGGGYIYRGRCWRVRQLRPGKQESTHAILARAPRYHRHPGRARVSHIRGATCARLRLRARCRARCVWRGRRQHSTECSGQSKKLHTCH